MREYRESQPGAKREPHDRSGAISAYPSPRRVAINESAPGSSILWRSRRTYTSMTFENGSVRGIPDMLGNLRPPQKFTWMARQVLQQRVLAGRQGQHPAGTGHPARAGVQFQRSDAQEVRERGPHTAAKQGAEASQELIEVERFCEVIVGTAVQARNPGVEGIARREHEHRNRIAGRAELRAHLQAILARKHHVQDDQVVVGRREPEGRIRSVGRHVHGKASFA